MELDRIDREILAALQNDGRLSNKELSNRVGLAPSSCHERVKRLRNEGVIQGCSTVVEATALGIALQAMVSVRLVRHSRKAVDAFYDYVRELPEVIAVYHVTGDADFLVHVAVRDTEHLRDLAMDAFTTRAEVGNLETSLVFRAHRSSLPDLLDTEDVS